MPIGCYSLVPHVAHQLLTRRPKTVLDLGIGFGLYGAVVRQWLDEGVRPWRTYLVGVEGHSTYRNPTWELYDVVVVDTIQQFLTTARGAFDVILLMDVLEHFDTAAGVDLLSALQSILSTGGALIVGTPGIFCPQEAIHGNELECHRSLWSAENLKRLGFRILQDGSPDEFGNRMVLALSERSH